MNNVYVFDIQLFENDANYAEQTVRALMKYNLASNLIAVYGGVDDLVSFFCHEKFSRRDINKSPKLVLFDEIQHKISSLEVLKTLKSD
jgi:hypothetical protein